MYYEDTEQYIKSYSDNYRIHRDVGIVVQAECSQ